MYPCRGVLHTPYKCPHRGQTNSPIWSDRSMYLFILTLSIPELFMSNNFRSLPGSFVGRMQYAPTRIRKYYAMIRSFWSLPRSFVGSMQYATTLPDEKRRSQNVFAMLFEAQNRIKIFLRYFLRLKIESKCSWCAFWGSKLSPNAFEVLFEAQNRMKMILRCFLKLKIESKYSWGTFWGSKSSSNAFEVLFEAQNRIKILLRYFLRLKMEREYFWGIFWGSKWSESVFEVYFLRKMGDKETAGHLLLGCPAVKQTFWVLHGTQNTVGGYLLLIDTSMRLPWESSWLAKSRTDSMVRVLTFFS